MPKLMLFAACEKVIIDQDNNTSLIALLSDLTADVPPPEDTPDKRRIIAAVRWSTLSLWERSDADSDDNQEYQQRMALYDPSGEHTGLEIQNTWKFGDKLSIRNMGILSGFPVYAAGRYVLKLWMQEKGQPEGAEPTAIYRINVKFSPEKG